jgi:histidine triad (HIT) family protein
MEDTIFTKIIKREIPAEIIYEDEHVIAILDKFPSMDGQTLVVTKRQAPYMFDLEETEYHALMDATKKVSKALDKAFNTIRTCAVIEGFEVPHIHIRLYPCKTESLVLSPRREASDEELKIVAEKVRGFLG